VILPRRAVQGGFVLVAVPDAGSEDGGLSVQRIPVSPAYGFDARLTELDEHETQWIALQHGREPPTGSEVIVTLLDQLEVGMRVRIAGAIGEPENADGEGSP